MDSLVLNVKYDAEGIDYRLDSIIDNELVEGLDIDNVACDVIKNTFEKSIRTISLVLILMIDNPHLFYEIGCCESENI